MDIKKKRKSDFMALLSEFFKQLGSSHCNATFVEIVSDNAKTPSEHLRSCTPIRRPLVATSSRIARYNSGCCLPKQPSARRCLSRYNSEPIQISPLRLLTPTGSIRWAPSALCQNTAKDNILVPPARSVDRWGVTRNNSDSALLSILPKRTARVEVSRSVLNSLERKCSASKVMGEIVQVKKSKSYSLARDTPPPTIEEEDGDAPTQGLIEQFFEIPGTSKRLDLEGKKHFIRSILDVPDADQEVIHNGGEEQDEDMAYSSPICSTARKVLGGIQAMIGFFLLVVQIISVELLGPVFLNANELFRTLLASIPGSSRSKDHDDVFLPLIGPSSDEVSSDACNGNGVH